MTATMNDAIRDMSDTDRVRCIANVLEVSEYEVFLRAYRAWFGSNAAARALERDFAQYLYFGSAPHWVRHYSRTLLKQWAPPPDPAPGQRVASALLRLMDTRLGRFLLQ